MRWITILSLASCDLLDPKGPVDDTATEEVPLESQILTFCSNSDCSDVVLYGGNSGDNVSGYAWLVDGVDAGSAEEIVVSLLEFGQFIEVELTVEDSNGNLSTSGVKLAPLSFTISEGGEDEEPRIMETIVIPSGVSCSNPIGVASIGGCLRLGDRLSYRAADLTASGAPSPRFGDISYDASQGKILNTPPSTFANGVAWYQRNLHTTVQFFDMVDTDYRPSGPYVPLIVDPLNPHPFSNPQSHMTFWFTPLSSGTQVVFTHLVQASNNSPWKPLFAPNKVLFTCADGSWVTDFGPVNEEDLNFDAIDFEN